MSTVEVRPFRRSDRDQMTDLVNAHVQAVVPGGSVPVNTVLSQLEGEPGEFVVDAWVTARATLVGEQRGRVVAAAHLLRYGDGEPVGPAYRGVGEIRWLLCWPPAPFWPDARVAGEAVAAASVGYLRQSGAIRIQADGTLPAPGVYGVPEQWPHVRALLVGAGFRSGGRAESVFLADVDRLARSAAPLEGLRVARSLGSSGTRLTGLVDDMVVGYIEVDTGIGGRGRLSPAGGWADVGNLWVAEDHRRQGLAGWLLGEAGSWLRWAHVDRLLAYAGPGEDDERAFLLASGFVELTRTVRDWTLPT